MSPSTETALVEVIGAQVGLCGGEIKDPWRTLTQWLAAELRRRFGEAVRVEYHDLLDPDCPTLPDGAALPLVLVEGRVITSGAKLSVPAVRRALEAAGIHPLKAHAPSVLASISDRPERGQPGPQGGTGRWRQRHHVGRADDA